MQCNMIDAIIFYQLIVMIMSITMQFGLFCIIGIEIEMSFFGIIFANQVNENDCINCKLSKLTLCSKCLNDPTHATIFHFHGIDVLQCVEMNNGYSIDCDCNENFSNDYQSSYPRTATPSFTSQPIIIMNATDNERLLMFKFIINFLVFSVCLHENNNDNEIITGMHCHMWFLFFILKLFVCFFSSLFSLSYCE